MTEVVKKITADEAFPLYQRHYPFAYSVSDKFSTDHLVDKNLSKKNSIEAALERYKRNQRITSSSWIMSTAMQIRNKAIPSSKKKAMEFRGAQQLSTQIKVTRRTVTIQRLNEKERHQYENIEVKIGTETHYLNCASEEKEIKLNLIGPWDPLTGKAELYHYEESDNQPDKHSIVAKYLEWVTDQDSAEFIRPVAKK